MIFHISVPVDNPKHVAKVIGEIIGGPVAQFVPGPNAYFVWSSTGNGVGLELIPRAVTHVPGRTADGGLNYVMDAKKVGGYTGGHLAMSAIKSADDLLAIAEREGWRALKCWRATAFPLVEMWLENHYMVEWFPPEIAQTYVDFSTPENWQQYFNMKLEDGIYMAQGTPEPMKLAREQVKLTDQ